MKRSFRFESLEVWQISIELGDQLFDIADNLEQMKRYRFAEQLRGAGMSISNNIAEGSESVSKKEFYQFLNFARRSCFECANILIVVQRRGYVSEETKQRLFASLDELSRKISSFQKVLCPAD
ncbi:four helix bundle protein [Spirosoma taeanense]|uniref:Four helix bundle protein n=1 Tax=Spirosoma taeanense TaxID=2735870 RepID=A0A6M5YAK9_9BACT|nr:four helix bundle protein [Spirosoma taeanense]QJW89892.1 four helix bundle protein [Spirosoma taeanense]